MKVISIVFNSDSLVIEKINLKMDSISNINTNKIVDDILYYTERYIKWNGNIVKDVLNKMFKDTVIFKDFDSYIRLHKFLKCSKIIFDISRSLPIRIIHYLESDSNLKYLECYFMPADFVHILAKKGVSIKFNNNMSFTSSFVSSNDLNNLKSIYYKKFINFYSEKEVYDNLDNFLKINDGIQVIHLYFYEDQVISFIVDKLNELELFDVNIFIHQNESNLNDIVNSNGYLRKINKKFKNDNREIKIIYSDEFFRNNIFKQLTINGLKLSMVVILYVSVIFMFSNKYHEFVALFNLRVLENNLSSITIDEMDDEEVNPPILEEPVEEETPPPKVYVNYYANIPTTFDKLLSINSDVKGWLKVNNTKVNYPVTQSDDNNYYLNHDIYYKEIITGWVFMDHRNNSVDLDRNTVIYGHNLISGYMFGDLRNTTNKDYYTNPDNQIITFNTLERNMEWKIISMYRTDYTTDYLKTNFFNDEEFMNFIDMIKSRSIYNFNVNVDTDDKILTLSTCTGSNNRRLVIHAVLLD